MHFDMTGVDHQPLKVCVIHQGFQNLFPDPLITPPAKPAVYILPVSIRLRQVPPRCSSTQYPEYTVDKLSGIPSIASSCPVFTDGVRTDFLPRFVIDVMTVLICCYFSALFFFEDYYITFSLTTPSNTFAMLSISLSSTCFIALHAFLVGKYIHATIYKNQSKYTLPGYWPPD